MNATEHEAHPAGPMAELEAIIRQEDTEKRIAAAAIWGRRWLLQVGATCHRAKETTDQQWAVQTGGALHELAQELMPPCLLRRDVASPLGQSTVFVVVAFRREPHV